MNSWVIWGIALGLAMDAFAVSIATSVSLRTVTKRQLFRFSWHFGLFQFMMPVIGWFLGRRVVDYVGTWDHWLAFILLSYVGGKAIYGAYREEDKQIDGETKCSKPDPTRGWSLVMLSVATSIDALAVGLGFAFADQDIQIWYPCFIIGIVAAGMTLVGMLIGSRLGERFGERMEILGGLILIGIGIQIVLKHIMGS